MKTTTTKETKEKKEKKVKDQKKDKKPKEKKATKKPKDKKKEENTTLPAKDATAAPLAVSVSAEKFMVGLTDDPQENFLAFKRKYKVTKTELGKYVA